MKAQNLGLCHCALLITDAFFSSFKLVGFGTFSDQSLNSLIVSETQVSALSTSQRCRPARVLVPCPQLLPLLAQVSHCDSCTSTSRFGFVPVFCHPIESLSRSSCCQHMPRDRQVFPKGLQH